VVGLKLSARSDRTSRDDNGDMLALSDGKLDDSHSPSQSPNPGCEVGSGKPLPPANNFHQWHPLSFARSPLGSEHWHPCDDEARGSQHSKAESHWESTHKHRASLGARGGAASCAAGLKRRNDAGGLLGLYGHQSSGRGVLEFAIRNISKNKISLGRNDGSETGVTSAALLVKSGWTVVDDIFRARIAFSWAYNRRADSFGFSINLGSAVTKLARTTSRKNWRGRLGQSRRHSIESEVLRKTAGPLKPGEGEKQGNSACKTDEGAPLVNNRGDSRPSAFQHMDGGVGTAG